MPLQGFICEFDLGKRTLPLDVEQMCEYNEFGITWDNPGREV